MIIKNIYVGNTQEAYIERDLSKGFNIISSDDNNKGKTILIQSMMYALGNNAPSFPKGFNYKNYYYIVDFEYNNREYSICRKNKSFIIRHNDNITLLDNTIEFKYYIDKNLYKMPRIIKDGKNVIVPFELLFECFFVPQDNRITHNVILQRFYNKDDFINMLYNMSGIAITENIDTEKMRREVKDLKEEKKDMLKNNKILKEMHSGVNIMAGISNRTYFEELISQTENIKNEITELMKTKFRYINRKNENQKTLEIVRSLNKEIKHGKLVCAKCGSDNITYVSEEENFTFDISNKSIRNQISQTLEDRIEMYDEEIESVSLQIEKKQKELQKMLTYEDVSLENLLRYKDDFLKVQSYDNMLLELDKKIKKIENQLEHNKIQNKTVKNRSISLKNDILKQMQGFYSRIDSDGKLEFDDIFTKGNVIYSGSESTEFFLARIYALYQILKHDFPIVIDSFRAEELSTIKEKNVIEQYRHIPNQIIFTSTLKKEEIGKYEKMKGINHVNYCSHQPNKLLCIDYVKDFETKLKDFGVNMN